MEKLPSRQMTFILSFSQLAPICKTRMIRARGCVLGIRIEKQKSPPWQSFWKSILCENPSRSFEASAGKQSDRKGDFQESGFISSWETEMTSTFKAIQLIYFMLFTEIRGM